MSKMSEAHAELDEKLHLMKWGIEELLRGNSQVSGKNLLAGLEATAHNLNDKFKNLV